MDNFHNKSLLFYFFINTFEHAFIYSFFKIVQ